MVNEIWDFSGRIFINGGGQTSELALMDQIFFEGEEEAQGDEEEEKKSLTESFISYYNK